MDARPTIKKENPEMAFGDIAREISSRWADLDAKDKKPYLDKAAKDKERYEKEKAAYEGGGGKKSPKKTKKK